MWTRRETVAGGALTLLFTVTGIHSGTCATRAPHSRGCYLADADLDAVYPQGTDTRTFATGKEPMIPKSGDRDFDLALAQTLAKLSQMFQILPGFAYYDDYDGENAYATPVTRMNRADGTVLMGINFLGRLRRRPESPEVAVAAICAHEFAHILQYRERLMEKVLAGQRTVKRAELQADYLAGYFAGLRRRERPSFPAAVVALAMSDLGDTQFGNKNHHGTPAERGAAVARGFEASFRQGKSLSDAIEESSAYVMRL